MFHRKCLNDAIAPASTEDQSVIIADLNRNYKLCYMVYIICDESQNC